MNFSVHIYMIEVAAIGLEQYLYTL